MLPQSKSLLERTQESSQKFIIFCKKQYENEKKLWGLVLKRVRGQKLESSTDEILVNDRLAQVVALGAFVYFTIKRFDFFHTFYNRFGSSLVRLNPSDQLRELRLRDHRSNERRRLGSSSASRSGLSQERAVEDNGALPAWADDANQVLVSSLETSPDDDSVLSLDLSSGEDLISSSDLEFDEISISEQIIKIFRGNIDFTERLTRLNDEERQIVFEEYKNYIRKQYAERCKHAKISLQINFTTLSITVNGFAHKAISLANVLFRFDYFIRTLSETNTFPIAANIDYLSSVISIVFRDEDIEEDCFSSDEKASYALLASQIFGELMSPYSSDAGLRNALSARMDTLVQERMADFELLLKGIDQNARSQGQVVDPNNSFECCICAENVDLGAKYNQECCKGGSYCIACRQQMDSCPLCRSSFIPTQ